MDSSYRSLRSPIAALAAVIAALGIYDALRQRWGAAVLLWAGTAVLVAGIANYIAAQRSLDEARRLLDDIERDMVWSGEPNHLPSVVWRCQYCSGTYDVPNGAHIETYRTADPPPPSEVVVRLDGVIVHECRRGVQVEL